MKLGDHAVVSVGVIPSGSIALDVALGDGGYPRGRVVEIFGPESSGKTTLAKSIFGRVPIVHGDVQYYFSNNGGADLSENLAQIGYVSPDDYRDLIQRNLLEDTFRDFSGRIGEFTPARTLLFEGRNPEKVGPREAKKVLEVAHRMGIGHLLERPVEALSIGESRKFLIARALLRELKLLILDKPFDGLDQKSNQSFEKIIRQLIKDGICLILITNRTEEILRPFTHVLVMQEGKIVASGKKTDILEEGKLSKMAIDDSREIEIDEDLYGSIREASEAMVSRTARELSSAPETLLEKNGVTVKYDRVVVLDMVETIEGLRRFLAHAPALLAGGGQLLLDSLDVRVTDDTENLAYHAANRAAGRYMGEIRMRFEFQDRPGPYCGWLQVDAETLRAHAERAGWQCEVDHQAEHGDYLARLLRPQAARS